MPLWPFRRKSRRRRGRPATMDPAELGAMTAGADLPRSQTAPETSMIERHPSKRRKTDPSKPNKLQRRPRAYSFSPGREDVVEVRRKRSVKASAPAPTGTDAARDDTIWRIPTLRLKGDGEILRRQSSRKRKQEDRQREAEIKAMSLSPVRPAAEDWMAGRPLRKESKRVRTGFHVSFRDHEYDRHNQSSDISLPLAESIDSALSNDSDYLSYRVSPLDALAPRPTLRCSARTGTWPRGPNDLARRPSQRRRLADPIPEETLRAHKRIDSLADELSASDLRELMERDQRRRARKQQLEQERAERRIARRAEKQKAAEAEALKTGRESPPNLERGVLGREDLGVGVDPASAVVTSSKIRSSDDQVDRPDNAGAASDHDSTGYRQSDPRAYFHRVDSQPLEQHENPPPQTTVPNVPPTTVRSKSSLLRKLSRSKSRQVSETVTDRSTSVNSEQETSNKRLSRRSWSSMFRWGNKNRRNSAGPPSFSNTSRDSMPPAPPPPAPVPAPEPAPGNMPVRRVSAGVPKRTMSRFREDLPELPLSPPASRIQSPEAELPPPIVSTSNNTGDDAPPSPSTYRPARYSPAIRPRSIEHMRETPSTLSRPDEPGVSPEPQAMSLASIDSEGSWFAGRLTGKRKTSGLRIPRRTPESDSERPNLHEHSADDMDITDDEYLTRVASAQDDYYHHHQQTTWNGHEAGGGRPSSEWGEGEAHWDFVKRQQPMVVEAEHHAAPPRVKSHEGLLNSFGSGEIPAQEAEGKADDNDDDNFTEGGDSPVKLQRATSIDYGKASRRISAGSARLLDITPRSSVDKHTIRPSSVVNTAE